MLLFFPSFHLQQNEMPLDIKSISFLRITDRPAGSTQRGGKKSFKSTWTPAWSFHLTQAMFFAFFPLLALFAFDSIVRTRLPSKQNGKVDELDRNSAGPQMDRTRVSDSMAPPAIVLAARASGVCVLHPPLDSDSNSNSVSRSDHSIFVSFPANTFLR